MELTQLIYVSQATKKFSPAQLQELVDKASTRNQSKGLTGVLLYCGGTFLQMLEGDRGMVDATFQMISRDPRHTEVLELIAKPVRKRLFQNWGMGLMNLDLNLKLDRQRMTRLITDIRERSNTTGLGVEARVLIDDFRMQIQAA